MGSLIWWICVLVPKGIVLIKWSLWSSRIKPEHQWCWAHPVLSHTHRNFPRIVWDYFGTAFTYFQLKFLTLIFKKYLWNAQSWTIHSLHFQQTKHQNWCPSRTGDKSIKRWRRSNCWGEIHWFHNKFTCSQKLRKSNTSLQRVNNAWIGPIKVDRIRIHQELEKEHFGRNSPFSSQLKQNSKSKMEGKRL